MINRSKKITATALTVMMVAGLGQNVFAAENDGWTEANKTEAALNGRWEAWCEEWESIKNDWTQLSITPGKSATELNFAWYSKADEKNPVVKISKSSDMSDAIEFTGSQSSAVPDYLSNKVSVSGLEENTTYYYTYGTNGAYSEVVEIKTQSTDSFGFFLVGDPQIGSSLNNTASGETKEMGQDKAVRNDTFNWNNTINKALSIMPDASFIISAGDQVSIRNKKATTEEALVYTENEIEYAGYLSPRALKSLPVATTLGNHDAVSGNYSYHFNNPNASELGSTVGGGDYYYSYGNTLFIMLNTNNTNIAEHEQLINEAIASHSDATWKVVTLHQDIYGSGEHSNEPEIVELRYNLVPIFEKNDIDIVLTGHDHTYARSKILKGGTLDEGTFLTEDEYDEFFEAEFESGYENLVEDEKYLNYLKSIEDEYAVVTDLDIQSGKIVDPDGILYITANSASGSKYYDNVPRQQAYIANRWQEDVPTFSTINVDEVSLTISTYRTDDMTKIDETCTIVKSLDKSNLEDLIAKANEKNKDEFTVSSWSVFEAALTNAVAVCSKGDATSDIISQAYTDLNTAMNSLLLKGNVEELNKTIEEAEKIVNEAIIGTEDGEYPENAKTDLQLAIEEAKAVSVSDDSSQSDIDEAVENLTIAIKAFESKVVKNNEATVDSSNGENNNQNNTNTITTSKPNNSKIDKVNTGDNSTSYLVVCAAVASILLVVLNVRKRRERVKVEN